MHLLTKQDLFAAFLDSELCDLSNSKGLSPVILLNIVEKLVLQSLVNRLNRDFLIKEAKIRCIKNYARISKEELCIKLWNYMEPEDSINMRRISTCTKKASKHNTLQ